MQRIVTTSRKVAEKLRLLRQDPELLGRNLLQFTNPDLFERRLIDVINNVPMNVRIDLDTSTPPRLNVLDAAWGPSGMTGGPNTAINLALHVALQGIEVRIVATGEPSRISAPWLRSHASALMGMAQVPELSVVSAAAGGEPLSIGRRDVFLATHWSTVHQLKPILAKLPIRQFFYMLQEFEPGFYSWSSNFARAIETYELDFWPIVNQSLLADHLFSQPLGRLNDPAVRGRAIVFEPAVDRARFYPATGDTGPRPKRLLFYARPNNARNMFGLGLLALRSAAVDPALRDWEFLAIGGQGALPPLSLGGGKTLLPAPWLDYAGYADLLRHADMLLCPMLSPHTSYPVLEMVASGGIAVTNTFSTKTVPRLASLSSNIIAVKPTVEGLAAGLLHGAARVNNNEPQVVSLNMPVSWNQALEPAAQRVATVFNAMQRAAGDV